MSQDSVISNQQKPRQIFHSARYGWYLADFHLIFSQEIDNTTSSDQQVRNHAIILREVGCLQTMEFRLLQHSDVLTNEKKNLTIQNPKPRYYSSINQESWKAYS